VVFLQGEEAARDGFLQRVDAVVTLEYPGKDVDVAQATGTFLDVGFEVVGGVVVAAIALLLFLELGAEKLVAWPDVLRSATTLLFSEEFLGTGEAARLLQGGGDGDVLLRLGDTLFDGAQDRRGPG